MVEDEEVPPPLTDFKGHDIDLQNSFLIGLFAYLVNNLSRLKYISIYQRRDVSTPRAVISILRKQHRHAVLKHPSIKAFISILSKQLVTKKRFIIDVNMFTPRQ